MSPTTGGSIRASVLDKLSQATDRFNQEGNLRITHTEARGYGWNIDSIEALGILAEQLQSRIADEGIQHRKVVVHGRWYWVEICLKVSDQEQPTGAASKDRRPSYEHIATRYQPSLGRRGLSG